MTLPYSPSRAVYEGNGAATAFPFAFKVWSTDQLSISLTAPNGQTSPAQGWTANLGESGGTVTYLHDGTPLPAGWRLAIVRNMPFAQGIDLVSASRFDPQVIEDGLDQATAELQQLSEKIARAVIMPATSDQSPEEVVQSIYASRDAAAASANAATTQATLAQDSANAAAGSAATAAQAVQDAAANAVADATAQANAAADSANAAAQSAASAVAASGGLAPRMDAAEQTITRQATLLDSVASEVTALATSLIGSVQAIIAADSYVPNGCVPANGGEYTRAQFPTLYDTYLAEGKLLTCTYAAFAAQVSLTGNCTRFAVDADNKKFKVPLLKDGDSITQAANAAELGKSVKAGLPNITGEFISSSVHGVVRADAILSGALKKGATSYGNSMSRGDSGPSYSLMVDASQSNPIYGNSTTVTDEQVRLRHFVVLASAQNDASVFDWSNYMAALAGKANTDLSNATGNAIGKYFYARDEKPSGTSGGATSSGTWNTRDITTVKNNYIGATLASNKVSLPAGRYYIRANAPSFAAETTRLAIYNATSQAYLLHGPIGRTNPGSSHIVQTTVEGEIVLDTPAQIELRMWTQSANAYGMGYPVAGSGVAEIYSEFRAWKM